MSDTTFADYQPPAVPAAWLNDVNNTVYRALGAATTPAQAASNLGLGNVVKVFSVVNYGADKTGVADSTAAINAAIAAANAAGSGYVWFDDGVYLFTSLNMDSMQGITLWGPPSATSGGKLAVQLRSAAASGTLISAKTSSGIALRGVSVEYTNAAFNGVVIDFSGTNPGTSTSFPQVEDCYIAGFGGATGASALVKIPNTSGARIIRNDFQLCGVAIKGRASTADFINACTIEDNRFATSVTNHIQDIQSGQITGNWFEPLTSGAAGAYADTFEDIGGGGGSALLVAANWCGDVAAGIGGIQWDFQRRTALVFIANNVGFHTTGTGLRGRSGGSAAGWVIKGNTFSAGNSGDTGIDLSGMTSFFQYDITPNNFQNVATQYNFSGALLYMAAAFGFPSVTLQNFSSSDGRATIRYLASAGSTAQWDVGLDPGGGTTKTWRWRNTITAKDLISIDATGNLDILQAGNGLKVAEGSNAKQGTATLIAGSIVVGNTSITANSRIFLTSQADGGTPGWLRVSARVVGTSFTIQSSSGTDTSTVAYEIFEPG